MSNNSNWTGKTSRSLSESLGPYTTSNIEEDEDDRKFDDLLVMWFCLVMAALVAVFFYFGVIV